MSVQIFHGDCRLLLKTLDNESVNCCVTSPPYYGLRDYGVDGQIGREETPVAYVDDLVSVFREVRRVLRGDGTVWLNLGDSYATHRAGMQDNPMAKSTLAGVRNQEVANKASRESPRYLKCAALPEKNLIGVPWRVAFALQSDGWIVRQDIIWSKPNPMPESVTDRCTKSHEYMFLLSKSGRYYYDQEAILEPITESSIVRLSQNIENQAGSDRVPGKTNGAMKARANPAAGMRNRRSVWTVTTQPFKQAHFATFPPALIEPCIKAGCPKGGMVLDPFGGAGTTGLVADRLQRNAILFELNPEYVTLAENRIRQDAPLFA